MGLKELSNTQGNLINNIQLDYMQRKNTFPDHHHSKKASSVVIKRKLAFKRFKEARLFVPSCRFMVM